MNDNDKATFEPFITVCLGSMKQSYGSLTTRIAVASNAPGVTAIHWYDAPAARRLVDEINKLIAVLDPPGLGWERSVVADAHLAVQRPKKPRGRPRAFRKVVAKRKGKRK